MSRSRVVALILLSIICAGTAGATIESFSHDRSVRVNSGTTETVFQTVTRNSVLTEVQFVTEAMIVTTIATFPPIVTIEGSVYSEVYPSLYVSFIHCLPVAYVACNTYTSKVARTENFSENLGKSNYSYYVGTYSVTVPNNETYGVGVGFAVQEDNGSSLAALSTIPLFALSPVIGNYNIDCFFTNSNYELSNINCASD